MMSLVSTASRRGAVHVRRPRLLRALVRREVNGLFAVLLPLSAILAAVAAREARMVGLDGGMPPLIENLLRRFDLTMLFLMVLVLALRTASRIEADHVSGWLSPAFAAGMSRRTYAAAAAFAVFIVPAAVFASSASVFAFSVRAFDGTPELVNVLHHTLGAGLLVLGTYGVCAAAVGTALRRALPTVFVIVALVLVPIILLVRHLALAEPLPLWLWAASLVSPLIVPPNDTINVLRAVVYILIGSVLLAVISHRCAGRHQ